MSYPYESATPEQRAIGSFWWCIHHGIKLEPLAEPIEIRVRYIREGKAAHEVETRLRAMRPVAGALPEPVQRVNAELRRVSDEWRRVYAEHAAEIDALFAAECADVPWGPNGLVFPKAK